MKTVLILAYYFPPLGLGGVQRALKFVKYLPQYGWRPIVVTVKDIYYYDRDATLLKEIPAEAQVYRTGSFDPLRIRHLIGGRASSRSNGKSSAKRRAWSRWVYFPDNQIGWAPFAVIRAHRIIRSERVDALLSTFPPASGHLAALWLYRASGIPWIADFRDGWVGGEFDRSPTAWHRALNASLQRQVVRRASHITAVSDGIAEALSDVRGNRTDISIVENGYDPDDFAGLKRCNANQQLTLTYCGTLNSARNPEPLFRALRLLLDRRPDLESYLEVRLVGAVIGLDIPGMLRAYRLEAVVRLIGYRPHREALEYMVTADGLILLISSEDETIRDVPTGKIYECLAAGRPVLGIAPDGAAGNLLLRFERGKVIHPNNPEGIAARIELWASQHAAGTMPHYPMHDTDVQQFSRPHLTERLSGILHHVTLA